MAANVIQFSVQAKDKNSKSVFGGIAKGILGVAAALGIVAGLKTVGNAVVEFERLRLSINTVSDSAKDAQKNMAFIEEFAATTPFDLNQVTEGFIKLKALGLDPSEEALRSYGNTASAMGKDLNQMIEAIADAATGEFERLKEFGIKARKEGEIVKFTFQGVTTQIANNANDIEGFLRNIGETEFAGAMQTQADSVVGAVSNMGDNFNRLAVAIGDAGLRPIIKAVALAISNMIQVIIDNADKIQAFIRGLVTFGLVLKQVFVTIFGAIKKLFEQDLKTAFLSILTTLQRMGGMIIDWAVGVIPAMARVLLGGFGILLKGLIKIFINAFTNIASLIGAILIAALQSLVGVFKAFGEAVNDMIQAALLGEDASFTQALKERFNTAFTEALSGVTGIKEKAAKVGGAIVDGTLEAIGELKGEIVPLITESADEIVGATSVAANALADLYGINMEGILAQAEAMTTGISAFQDKAEEVQSEQVTAHESMMSLFRTSWETFIDDQGSFVQEFAKNLVTLSKGVSKSIGKQFADTVVDGKNLMKGLLDIGKQVVKALIAQLVELGVQRLVLSLITKTAVVADSTLEGAKAAKLTFGNQMASMSAAPFPINLTAPAVAAAMTSTAIGGMAGAAAAGASIGGVAHGGLENVPSESTFLLQKGERVLSPKQNTDLTDFLGQEQGGAGSSISIENINMNVLENVTDIDSFLNLTESEIKEVVATRIITALDQLDEEGVRPAFVDRSQNL